MEAVFGLRQAHISQHLMVLREAGLVSDRRDGWNIFYRVIRPDVYQVLDAAHLFSGAAPGEGAATPAKTGQDCPCPKCSTTQAVERVALVQFAAVEADR
jgi:ArsR family transcriptional regulator